MPYDSLSDDELMDELEKLVQKLAIAEQSLDNLNWNIQAIEEILRCRGYSFES